ncbi:MAG: hypothetical protein HY606_14805 [Planctomycetes bacterium]|nr:hypothetical protein [Planctomycetota bacterium]
MFNKLARFFLLFCFLATSVSYRATFALNAGGTGDISGVVKYDQISSFPTVVCVDGIKGENRVLIESIKDKKVAAVLSALKTSYCAVTDKDGKFRISDVPAGQIILKVWNEKLGSVSKGFEVTVEAGKEATAEIKLPLDIKYVGSDTCKNCHKAKDKGDAYGKWKDSKHSKAYEILGSDEAKKVAKEKGVDDPQTSQECLRCHVTAAGADKGQLGAKFDMKHGVQCELCHGPGDKHAKTRLMSDDDIVKKGEIDRPTEFMCLGCHNSASPQYKEFKFEEFYKKIEHPNPKKKK